MRRRTKRILKIVIGSVIAVAVIVTIVLLCVGKAKQSAQNETTPTPTVAGSIQTGIEDVKGTSPTVVPSPTVIPSPTDLPTEVPVSEPTKAVEPTATAEPTAAPEEPDVVMPTDVPEITDAVQPTPEAGEPTKAPEVTNTPDTDEPKATDTPSVSDGHEVEPTAEPVPTVTLAPTVTATPVPTKAPTATPTPTVTPTPAPKRKYTYEAQMGDNVWYRLSEDRILYVTGTGATWGLNYTYDKATNKRKGADSRLNVLLKVAGAQHIVIEEGITKLGKWSLMWLPQVQTVTFPKSLQEIEEYCFLGTAKRIDSVYIGLDKSKVKLSPDAFYGTIYQTEEDIKKPTPIPTSSPTPTSLPMVATDFYRALVEEAGIKIDENDKEPYGAALAREGILTEAQAEALDRYLFNREVARILYITAQKYNLESNEETVTAAKKYNRISDTEGIFAIHEDAVYFCFGNGIMPGKSDGEYTHTRSFGPEDKVRVADAVLYCKRLFHPEERVPMSPDAQVIRTTNLPVQAKLYPYILESFPNEYYDMNYLYMYNLETDDRAYSDVPENVGFLETWCTPNTVDAFSEAQPEKCKIYTSETDYLGGERVGVDKVVERYRDTWEQQAKEYLELILNFDYRTAREDVEWQNRIKNLNVYYHERGQGARSGTCAGINCIDKWFEEFLDNAEMYHTVAECEEIDFDMSTLFYSELFDEYTTYTIRVHLHYRITTDAETGFYEMAEVLPICAYGVTNNFISFGEWKDVYAELTFATNSFDRTGTAGLRIIEYNVNDGIRYHFDPLEYVK